jgi:hypothetical protein
VKIIQIVPRLPPEVDGLGDYALNLARQFRKYFGIESHFIACYSNYYTGGTIEGFKVTYLKEHSATLLLSELIKSESTHAILVHYVGYGYAKRGAPIWLIQGLQKWRNYNQRVRLLTMFHEIYAKGPIWTSSFWLSPLQKYLAARLARLSNVCFTSRQGYAGILSTLNGSRCNPIITLPVFSNIGEPEEIPLLLKNRKRRIIIFGGRGNRLRVYEKSIADLERVCRSLEIEEIIDVGPTISLSSTQVNGIPLTRMGKMATKEVSDLLSNSIVGFFHYDTAFLAKSTIFAAYSAHRLIPISASCGTVQADGLEANTHYWVANSEMKNLNLAIGQKIADNAYNWYQNHRLAEHVKTFVTEMGVN